MFKPGIVQFGGCNTADAFADKSYCRSIMTHVVPLTCTIGETFDITGGASIGLVDQTGVTAIPAFTTFAGTATITITKKINGVPQTPVTCTITVNPKPNVTQPASIVALCAGTNTTPVTFGGSVPGTIYNWTNNTPSIGLAASGTGNIAAFTVVNTGINNVVATITVTPSYTNAGITCYGDAKTFTITVKPIPTVIAPANQSYCRSILTAAIPLTGSVVGTTFDITGGSSIGLADQTGLTEIPAFTTFAGTATVTITPIANGCTGTPVTYTITVNPKPNVTQPASQAAICAGTNSTPVIFATSVPGTIYNWVNNNPSIGLAASGTGNIEAFALVNPGITNLVATITVTPSYTNAGITCYGDAKTFTITVKPIPTVIAPANQSYCRSITAPATPLTGTVPGTTFNIAGGSSIGLADQTGLTEIPAFTTFAGTATVTITPIANGCTGTPVTYTITVNPKPNVTQPVSQVLCAGVLSSAIPLTGTVIGATFNITGGTAVGLADQTGVIAIPAFTPIFGAATITVTPVYTGAGITCYGDSKIFTITVNNC